jgi:enoyl-CoA hydratase
MSYETILVERVEANVGLVRLNRPKQLNALNTLLMRELTEVLQAHDADDSIGCHLLTGNDAAFAAGADIKEMMNASAVEMFTRDMISLWDRLATLRKPVIAAVSGFCLGGGLELAMTCDLIIASDTAKFRQPEITIGVIPGAGGTQRLTRAIGKALAMEMILNDRTLTAAEAAAFGLINRVLPVESYFEDALKTAREIAKRPPLAVRLAKEAINRAFETTLREGIDSERRSFYFLFATEDQKEGMTAFLEKRQPQWKGE